MPSKKSVIKAYVTDEEYARVASSATRAGLSISQFTRRVTLGSEVMSRENAVTIRELLKVNADMGRLGGLLKLWLSAPDSNQEQARKLLHELELAKEILVEKIQNL